jgi:integrase
VARSAKSDAGRLERGARRRDGTPKRRAPIVAEVPGSLDAHAAAFFGGALAGRSAATRKGYRDAWERFRAFLVERPGLDPATDGLERLPPNALAAFYRWLLEHPERPLAPRSAATYAHGVAAFFRQLAADGALPPGLSLERLRAGLRQALIRGDYERRRVDPRIDAFVAWVIAQPVPADDGTTARLDALRARALVLTLYGTGVRREEATKLRVGDVLHGEVPGEADIRGKGDRERTVFFDDAALAAIRAYVEERRRAERRPSPYLFASHGNRRRADGRLHPRTVWAIVKALARRAELAEADFAGLTRALHTHDTRHHYARTVLNNGAGLSVVQDLLGHASPETTKRIYATTDRAVRRAAARAHAPRPGRLGARDP